MKKSICFPVFISLILLFARCQKIEYTSINDPAYIRVFNSLNYKLSMEIKGGKLPYLCMLINPQFNEKGIPVGAETVGDFLDVRNVYAPPYPSNIGASSTKNNPEYPGKERVLAGPILNGFDLSSWAQVPSGKVRMMFYFRPVDNVGFFNLSETLRQEALIDTTFTIDAGEVYTMNVLMNDFVKKDISLHIRQENFHKLPLADTSVYVNFYNYSAKGYWQADKFEKVSFGEPYRDIFTQGIRDTMNVYLTLRSNEKAPGAPSGKTDFQSESFTAKYLTTVIRNTESTRVQPYQSFPLWANPEDDRVSTRMAEILQFVLPGMDPQHLTYNLFSQDPQINLDKNSEYAWLTCFVNPYHYPQFSVKDYSSHFMPNLIITTHSGSNNPQSFGSVNTVEVINGKAYLMTIQRRYVPPIYN